ncbi:MAG: hypothetical protein IT560_14335 [Alphaproteobacteria bacterium]|jgi:hypothetical protein|nr:hypothetical protein [Alphaproteobacteria bacterium]
MSEPDPKKKKPSFKQSLKTVFNGLTRKELRGVLKDTFKDLRKPKEIGVLLLSSFVPGGWIGYAGYRIAKYKLNHAPPPANDNAEPAAKVDHKVIPAPKPPTPPKP